MMVCGMWYVRFAWRYGRQATGIFIIDKVRTDLTPIIFPGAFEDQ